MAPRIIRPARKADLDTFVELGRLAGPGFTSLQAGSEKIGERLDKSEKSFALKTDQPGEDVFCMVLEDESGAVLGTSAVKSQVGLSQPFVNFRVSTTAQYSEAVPRFFPMEILSLVTDCQGFSEVGTLFLRKEARGGGMGFLLSASRYMLIAAAPERFGSHVLAELRGLIDDKGRSPFWEAVGRKFFDMDFEEADTLSSRAGNQFLWDLLPKYPIYVDLLPQDAREAIGAVHPEGLGARRLLESQGFRYEGLVDVFDAGPLLSARKERLKCLQESRRWPIAIGEPDEGGQRAMASNDDLSDFRCCLARVRLRDDRAVVDESVAKALNLTDNDHARIWVTE